MLPRMIDPRHILDLAQAYGAARDVPLVTVSHRCFGDSKKLAAIDAGADLTTRRYVAALQWFSDHWPAEVSWPAHVLRPEPAAVPA
jgi:hypothetical protein